MITVRLIVVIVLAAVGVAGGAYYFTTTHSSTVTQVQDQASQPSRESSFGKVETAKQMVFPNGSAAAKQNEKSGPAK